MGLDLAQEGKKVTGTLATPHGDDLRVDGEFVGGTLTLATPGGGDSHITMTAKLKDDGTLDGYISSQMGDMTWTAKRAHGQVEAPIELDRIGPPRRRVTRGG